MEGKDEDITKLNTAKIAAENRVGHLEFDLTKQVNDSGAAIDRYKQVQPVLGVARVDGEVSNLQAKLDTHGLCYSLYRR